MKITKKQRTSSINNSIEDENFNYMLDEDMIDDGAYEEEHTNIINDLDSDNYNDDYDVIVMPSKQKATNSFHKQHFYHSDHELRQSRESSIDTNHINLKLNASTDQVLLNLNQKSQRARGIEKHDLSANTLSVDSGLSVPTGGTTSTNSDPESEKSSNNHNFLTNALANVTANAASVLIQINKHLNKNENDDKCSIASSESSSTNNNQQLKRQKRMLFLNSNSTEEQEDTYVSNKHADEDYFYTRKINKKLIESSSLDSILISDKNPAFGSINLDEINRDQNDASGSEVHTKKRCSIKSVVAPLAPHLQKQTQEPPHNLPHVVLVPYEVSSKNLPLTYQKSDCDRSINSIKSKASLDLNEVVATANLLASSLNDLNENGHKQKISNSTLTESNVMHNTTTNTTTTTYFQPNNSYFNHNRHPHARRRSIVKLNIEKTFNSLQTSFIKNIHTGFGLASEFMVSSPVKHAGTNTANSSTTENFVDDLDNSNTDQVHTSTSFGSIQSNLSEKNLNNKILQCDKSPSSKISSTIYVPYSPKNDDATHRHSSSVFSNNSFNNNNNFGKYISYF
jgi:hypothetical protein